MSEKGKLVLYTGCSGVGKGTIMKELLKRDPSIRLSVSNTTRKPREGEIDGVHYNFVSREDFIRLADADGYIEYAEYCKNLYGTPKKQVEDMLAQGCNVFLEIEVKGGLQVMEKFPDVLSIFILPPSVAELERRLRERGTETEEVIKERLSEAENELKVASQYKYQVINDDLDHAVEEVLSILHQHTNNII
ncbi:guanylate kinase [Roseburia sp. MSJ-14]|uniref:guanylate kinase n=1 Tax=Roseburia sp. MSJ-14 TaxID=2841514 RepID=UPI001C0FDE1A|nr:guanylate kinase [Roseburia sp. MSJ-14]MBU5471906.1 guanylate kinase [Roseburia sp. MSJ-14]